MVTVYFSITKTIKKFGRARKRFMEWIGECCNIILFKNVLFYDNYIAFEQRFWMKFNDHFLVYFCNILLLLQTYVLICIPVYNKTLCKFVQCNKYLGSTFEKIAQRNRSVRRAFLARNWYFLVILLLYQKCVDDNL